MEKAIELSVRSSLVGDIGPCWREGWTRSARTSAMASGMDASLAVVNDEGVVFLRHDAQLFPLEGAHGVVDAMLIWFSDDGWPMAEYSTMQCRSVAIDTRRRIGQENKTVWP